MTRTVNSFKEVEKLRQEPTIHDRTRIKDSSLGCWTEIRENCKILNSVIDDYSYLMERVQVSHSNIGKFCSIASDVRICPSNHPISRPTSHHMTYRCRKYGFGEDDPEVFNMRENQPVEIGNDVWIGHGAIILPDVNLGNGAVIGAGAVVTKDVQPYDIVAGVPGEKIGERFPEKIADKIQTIGWWDWPHQRIKKNIDILRDIEKFLEKFF